MGTLCATGISAHKVGLTIDRWLALRYEPLSRLLLVSCCGRFAGSLTLFDGLVLVEKVVIRVSPFGSFTGSLTQPEHHRNEIDKRIDGYDQPSVGEKDASTDVDECYEDDDDERPQEECIYRGLAHRNECVSCFLKKVSNGHSGDLAFLEPFCSMSVRCSSFVIG